MHRVFIIHLISSCVIYKCIYLSIYVACIHAFRTESRQVCANGCREDSAAKSSCWHSRFWWIWSATRTQRYQYESCTYIYICICVYICIYIYIYIHGCARSCVCCVHCAKSTMRMNVISHKHTSVCIWIFRACVHGYARTCADRAVECD
jgi:hypothetical protein